MFGYSTRQATETGNLEINQAQFRHLTFARNASAQAIVDDEGKVVNEGLMERLKDEKAKWIGVS